MEEQLTSMFGNEQMLEVRDASDVAEARRVATRLTSRIGFNEVESGHVALIATELASNLVKHAKSGRIVVSLLQRGSAVGFEVKALDSGPGIASVTESLRDGYSTSGTAGTGLGAVKRLAQEFDIYSVPGKGTAVLARVWSSAPGRSGDTSFEFGAVCLPFPGETVSGDGWEIDASCGKCTCVVVDGLGHGPNAAQAAQAALATTREQRGKAPAEIVERAHGALRSTRGAAIAVAEIDPKNEIVRFCGVGNIVARIASTGKSRHMVSYNGIVGQEARKIVEFTYPWGADALLVMHSDGLTARWDFGDYSALLQHHPALIAGVLYRDYGRGRDDATVLISRQGRCPL
jgi:anti-sigma regulatory factor (Ser/Thr protein kinase)